MKILISGWFSFKVMGATAGDLLCKELISKWLRKHNIAFDVALDEPFQGGVKWSEVDPKSYSHVIFTCGPFGNGEPVVEFLEYFKGVKLIGINLSMLQDLNEWNPFNLLLERDSSRTINPDLVFLTNQNKVPVVGLILVEPQNEYGKKASQKEANQALRKLLDSQQCAVVEIDTRLDVPNKGGLKSPEAIESLISRMDVVVTTRLHGMVLALKNGIPVLALDAIRGGAKIVKQAKTIGWDNVIIIDRVTEENLIEGFKYCLSDQSKLKALACRQTAIDKLADYEKVLMDFIQ